MKNCMLSDRGIRSGYIDLLALATGLTRSLIGS